MIYLFYLNFIFIFSQDPNDLNLNPDEDWIEIGQIKAIDYDSPPHSRVHYHVDSADFRVNTYTGELKASRAILDHEIADSFELNVTASDGLNKETIRVLVRLIDVNDNKPVFDMPVYRFQLSENRIANSIGFVQAFDTDKPGSDFSRIRYMLVVEKDSSNYSDYFRLDEETGELVQLKEFDYETGSFTCVSINYIQTVPTLFLIKIKFEQKYFN